MKRTFLTSFAGRCLTAVGLAAALTMGVAALRAQSPKPAASAKPAPTTATAPTTAKPVSAVSKPMAMKCSECKQNIAGGTMCEKCAASMDQKLMATNDMLRGVGFVYTLDNDVQRNGLVVLRRQSDGTLVPLPGSPFQTGGRGLSGGDIDEQGAIRVHGKYVLAVNPGSDSIAVLEKSNRGLLHVEGSPFPSGGSTPLSLTVYGDLVYVANQAAPFANPKSEPNVTGFRIGADGKLTPIANSTVKFPVGQGPAQVEFSPTGETLAATAGFQADDGSRLYSFRVGEDGRLTMGPGSPIAPRGASGTVGFSWGPQGNRLYASLFKGSAVIAFDVHPATGAIRQAGEPIGDDQRAACWTAISRDGRTLYVGNFVSNSISVYDVAGSKLTLLGSIPRRGATNKDTKDIELSRDGKYVYAIGSGERQISIFRVEANRLLTELPPGQSPVMVATGQNTTGLLAD